MMNWYTCILHVANHVTPVQYFFTRAVGPDDAGANAVKWLIDGDPDWTREDIDVPIIFEGRHEPSSRRDPTDDPAIRDARDDYNNGISNEGRAR